ncbi:MAG TPA: GspH/FimT family pseudopilin [candidate division Zixibacteria bacterium]|nr:GspH/FimT family pseudopilin [candidate division Zixibacteria bacterium]
MGILRKFGARSGGFVPKQGWRAIFYDCRGFTLGEMMAAVAVFAILGAVAIPSYLAVQPAMELNGAAREVLVKLMWARSKAVEQNTIYQVDFLASNYQFQVFNDANGNGSLDADEWNETYDLQALEYPSVTFSKTGNNPVFIGRGTTTSGTTTITLSNASGSKTVEVTPTGNVKIN